VSPPRRRGPSRRRPLREGDRRCVQGHALRAIGTSAPAISRGSSRGLAPAW
jgi:hypothetical protein